MVSVFQESPRRPPSAGIAAGLVLRHVVHAGISACRAVSWQSAGNTPSSFCRAKVSSRLPVRPNPSSGPGTCRPHSRGTWVGLVVAPGAEITEERPVGASAASAVRSAEALSVMSAMKWPNPHSGVRFHLDRRALVQTRIPLVSLACDKPVEVFRATAAAGPRVERPDRAGLPDRDFVALPNWAVLLALSTASARSATWCSVVLGCTPGAPVAISVIPPMPAGDGCVS